jgi:hypothetical protein
MDAKSLSQYTPQQQQDINLVRIHLQALTLSDLSTSDGRNIQPQALEGIRAESYRPRQNWPRQENVTASQRRLWKRYLKSHFIRYDLHWRQELGPSSPPLRPRAPRPTRITPTMMDVDSQSPESSVPAHDLKSYIARLPRWHQRLLSNYRAGGH